MISDRVSGQRISIRLLIPCLLFLPLLSFGETHFTEVGLLFNVRGYSYFGAHGACWVDVDRDGKLDLFVKNAWAQGINAVADILYMNQGTSFVDEASQRGVADPYPWGTHGAVFADMDRDKDFDLFASTTFNLESPVTNHLYRNDGSGNFLDITSSIVPAAAPDTTTRGVAAGDFDGDGDIDFYFSNALTDPKESAIEPQPPQQLANFLINNGDGTFTPEYRGIDWTGFVQGVCAVDVDGDGDLDIAEAKWTPPSTIYLNDGGGHFHDAGVELGLSSAIGEGDNGIAFGDVDNDGDLDLAIINKGRVALWKNKNGHFVRYQVLWLSRSQNGGYDIRFGDFDNDGWLEIYVSGDTVYDNDQFEGEFAALSATDIGLDASANALDPRGAALGDYDNDGDLDIFVADKDNYNLLFRNDINNNDWIEVEIMGDPKGTIGAIGTNVYLYEAGHVGERSYLKGFRQVLGETGYLGQDMPTVHFGASSLGEARYDLEVTFLDGTARVLQNLAPGQKIQVAMISPPLNFKAAKKENRALLYRETVIELTWQANSLNTDVNKYRIYAFSPERMLLGEVTADTFKYVVRNVNKTMAYTFGITAVDFEGSESEPAYAAVSGGLQKPGLNRKGSLRALKGKK